MAKNNTNTSKKNSRASKRRENIIIIAVALIIALVCAGLVALVIKYVPEHEDEHEHEGDATEFEYPEYSETAQTTTEGAYYNTEKTGIGLDVDMEKVAEEIGAYKHDDFIKSSKQTDFVVIRVENYGDIVLALREDIAPKTVARFKELVASGFYKNTLFSRVLKDVLVQGGGVTASGESKTSSAIDGEFNDNGYPNNLKHIKGVITMHRSAGRDSATNQFFISCGTSESLDGLYASFGYVLAGTDIIDAISRVEVTTGADSYEKSSPKTQIIIKDVFFVEPKTGTGVGVQKAPLANVDKYSVKIVDTNGNPVVGATFRMVNDKTGECPIYTKTNAKGEATFSIEPAAYSLKVLIASGYVLDLKEYHLQQGATEITVTLEKAQ